MTEMSLDSSKRGVWDEINTFRKIKEDYAFRSVLNWQMQRKI